MIGRVGHAASPAGECGVTPKGKNNAGGLRPAVGAWTRQAWLACFGGANGWKGHIKPASSALGGQGREAGRARRLPLPLLKVLAFRLGGPSHSPPIAGRKRETRKRSADRLPHPPRFIGLALLSADPMVGHIT